MMRRDPKAILAAHVLDPQRRELYVEGSRDHTFLKWLVGDVINRNARILEIGTVDLPESSEGGERGRLLRFAKYVEGAPAQIRFFADADMDRIIGRSAPANVWLTDSKDLEGYLLREDCLDKALKLGLSVDDVPAGPLLTSVLSQARTIGLLRVMSERQTLSLPFQGTKLDKYLGATGKRVLLERERYVQTLLQNASLSLTKLPAILADLETLEKELAATPDHDLVHGKDALCLLERSLILHGIARGVTGPVLWTSFDRSLIVQYPALDRVCRYLTSP